VCKRCGKHGVGGGGTLSLSPQGARQTTWRSTAMVSYLDSFQCSFSVRTRVWTMEFSSRTANSGGADSWVQQQ
jgi:hypothetical protein